MHRIPFNDNAPKLPFPSMGDVRASSADSDFASRLRQLRRAKGLSQTALGELVDLHYTHIGRYERGSSRPSAAALRRLADALGVSADYLLEGTTEDAARADFEDRELLRMFQEVDRLGHDDKAFIKKVLDALLTKKKIQALAGE